MDWLGLWSLLYFILYSDCKAYSRNGETRQPELRHQKVVSVTHGNSNEYVLFTNGIKMKYLLAKNMTWKRGKSTQKNTRNNVFSAQLFDAIYENNLNWQKISLMMVRWM
jgi:hypothetical protein